MKKKLVLMTSALMAISLLSACNQHTHDWGEATYTWSQDNKTCVAERVCKGDESHKETETAQSTYAVVTEAKCETDGKGRYSVSFENEAFTTQSKDIVLEKIEHEWGAATYVWAEDNSSCTATRVCAHDSSHKETETKNSVLVPITPATCTEAGVGKYVVEFENSAFAEQEKDNIVIDALGHDYQFDSFVWSEKWDSAQAKYVCSHDASHMELHNAEVTINTVPATCEADGKTTFTASYDGNSDIKESIIPAKNHSWGEPTYVWSKDHKTCTAKRVCTNDATHIQEETVNSSVDVQEDATCEQDGYGKFTAEFVNTAFAKQEEYGTIAKLGHDYQFDSFVWNEFEAQAKYICSRNESHIEYYDATVTSEVTTEPGCTTEGVRTYTATYDGHTSTKTGEEPAAGHDWEVTYNWSEDLSEVTANATCKKDVTHTVTEKVNTTNEVTKEATEEEDGVRTYTATFTEDAFKTQTKDVAIESLPTLSKLSFEDNGDETYSVIGKSSSISGKIKIPVLYNEKPVTKISESGFFYIGGITSVEFEKGSQLTSIAEKAFLRCTNLASIELPNSITTIGNRVFANCSSLTSINIPNSMASMGDQIFEECTNLTTITFAKDVHLETFGQVFYGASAVTSVIIESENCTFENIKKHTFKDCAALTTVVLPEGVKSLEVYAFLNCSVLSSLSLPSTITSLGTYVIDNCPLEELTFRGTIAQWNAIEKEDFVSYDSPLHVVHCTDGDVNL